MVKILFKALDGVCEIRFVHESIAHEKFITFNNFTQKAKFDRVTANGCRVYIEISINK